MIIILASKDKWQQQNLDESNPTVIKGMLTKCNYKRYNCPYVPIKCSDDTGPFPPYVVLGINF